MSENNNQNDNASQDDARFDMKCGIMLAIFASVLAIMDLGGAYSEYGMNIAQLEKTNSYAWYNAKAIRRTLAESQSDLLSSLVGAGVITEQHSDATHEVIDRLDLEGARYRAEMREILQGSAVVGKENWAQDINGEFGVVVGALEWEKEFDEYARVTAYFDLSNMILQICLVVGAISLVVQTPGPRKGFFNGAIGLGIAGTLVGIWAMIQYLTVA